MGAGAAQPQWTGIDKVIRDKFPEDYQGEWVLIYVSRVRTLNGWRLPSILLDLLDTFHLNGHHYSIKVTKVGTPMRMVDQAS